ncbi:MAG: hypothetical protein EBZ69_01020 [Alphaproteobacteria bacterium]|nr:hypothetical protein [Alphaproteobacteria bacterium]NDG04237.1 hypothetical protein [Alphaproteobacteria bacterium]
MADRFDLEDCIVNFHNIAADLDILADAVMEEDLSTDEIVNALIGLRVLVNLRAQKTFDVFTQAFKLDKHRECWSGQYKHAADADEELD